MEIKKENLNQAIASLRQCAYEQKNCFNPTCGIIVSSLCNDVADYLEKIKNGNMVILPKEEESDAYKNMMSPYFQRFGWEGILKDDKFKEGWTACFNWIKSK